MVEREPSKLTAGVRFSYPAPDHVRVAERPNARDCKSLKPSVRIRPLIPELNASLAQW